MVAATLKQIAGLKPESGISLAFEPELIPPPELMRQEAVLVMEDWFRWAEEWSVLLRVFGGLTTDSRVLEIGCGLGRVAYALRVVLQDRGRYHGFDICRDKIEFLNRAFTRARPNFRFAFADVYNTCYNPKGRIRGSEYRFPYPDASFDVVYAASVFTHMLPDTAEQYFREAARVLRPGGHCLFSFLLTDNYRPGAPRPLGFANEYFNVDHAYGNYPKRDFAIAIPNDPDNLTAYGVAFVQELAGRGGLVLARPPLPGVWSGSARNWIGAQDLVVLARPE